MVWEFRMDIHTVTFETDNQPGPTQTTENSAQCCVAAWMGGEFVGE